MTPKRALTEILALASWGFNVEADRVAAAAEGIVGMVVVLQQGDLAAL